MPDFQTKTFYLQGLELKKYTFEGRGFRCGSDKKMRRMWLGLGIVVVERPKLIKLYLKKSWFQSEMEYCILFTI